MPTTPTASTTFSPILLYQPGGGVPPGSPATTPPVYSQTDVTQLINGQSYIDVVFGTIQTDDDWVLVACEVENTIDFEPLNIWPGIITDRTAAGFRLQLNGMPDSSNYYLHWAVSGINIAPTPAASYLFTGPTSGGSGVVSTFTVRLPPSTTLATPVTVTPDDGGAGGTFSPTSVTLSSGAATQHFNYTPAGYGAVTISVTNSGTLADPPDIVFTALASTYTLSGPSSGSTGSASSNFTVALPVGGIVTGTVTVTPNDGGGGGTFTPATVGLTTGASSATFTYTPASAGTKTISTTDNAGLTDPASISYVVTAPFDPSTIAGLKLWLKADALPLADGVTVATWPDSSGNGNDFAVDTGTPTFKTNIVNSKPVVRFDGSSHLLNSGAIVSGNYTVLTVIASATVTGAGAPFSFGSLSGLAVAVERNGTDLVHWHWETVGIVTATDTGGITIGAWNIATADWNGSNIHLWRNGTLKDTTGTTLLGNTGSYNFVGANQLPQTWIGDIAEILVYNSALSITDRQAVESYLKSKYGIP